jgi:N-methylhydantoinase A
MILGIDVGGTFTDFCLLDDAGRVRTHKLLTSACDGSAAILQGIADGSRAQRKPGRWNRGDGAPWTVATNALLERSGACTALLTTFRLPCVCANATVPV